MQCRGPGAEKLTGLDPSDLAALLTQQAVLAESRIQTGSVVFSSPQREKRHKTKKSMQIVA